MEYMAIPPDSRELPPDLPGDADEPASQMMFTVAITDVDRTVLMQRKHVTGLDKDMANRTAAFIDEDGRVVLWQWSNLNGFSAEMEISDSRRATDRNLERARLAGAAST